MARLSMRRTLACFTLLLGATAIVGWLVRVPILVQILPSLQAMTFATALCFLLAGSALLVPQIAPRRTALAQSAIGIAVLGPAGAMLAEQISGADLGVDLPALHAWLNTSNPHPGRMSTNTAVAFVLVGGTLGLMHCLRGALGAATLGILTCAVIAIGVAGIVGYLLGVEFIYNWYGYASIAVPSE